MKAKNLLIGLLACATVGGGCLATATVNTDENPDEQSALHCTRVNAPAPAETEPADYPHAPEISAKAAFLLENRSGKVLFAKNPDQRLPIASMTKVATLGVIYAALERGEISMDDMVLVSERAASMGGSQAFLDYGSEYRVHDLIQSIVVASANDSCVALAEKIAGSVEAFVEMMNDFAAECGCQNTHFVNCTGLPMPNAYSCARDMAKMYQRLLQSPHYGDFTKVWLYDLTHPSGRVTGLTNTNKLVRQYAGCLGGKTGFTNEAGHCITVAAEKNGLMPIAVIIGAENSKTRFAESRALLDYAANNFENRKIVDKTQPLCDVRVNNAVIEWTQLYPARDYYHLTPKGTPAELAVAHDLPTKLNAPLRQADAQGTIMVTEQGKVIAEIPAVLESDIPAATYMETVQKLARASQW